MIIEKDDDLIEGMHEAVDAAAAEAARVLRKKYIIPFCDYYRFKFMAGNGTCVFVSLLTDKIVGPETRETIDHRCDQAEEESETDVWNGVNRKLQHQINDALNVLHFEILCDGPLGGHFGWDSWIEDYNPEIEGKKG